MREIASLESIKTPDPGLWGGKAAALCRLAQTGLFDIPAALVLSADEQDIPDEDFTEAIRRGISIFGDSMLAVRSSSTDEDRADSSAAGRYATVLGARGPIELEAAIRKVLGSADKAPMGVIVQRLINARAAGVAFSADPITGQEDQALINAVPGLGDKLVSGEVTPESWRVDGTGSPTRAGIARVISEDEASRIAALVRKVADLEDSPEDIEWAIDMSGRLFLLQARPITALFAPVPLSVDVPPGFWQRDNSHTTLPLHPMTASVIDLNPSFKLLSEGFGFLGQAESRNIGGWQYLGMLPLGMAPKSGRTPRLPGWAVALLLFILPAGRQRITAARRQRRDDTSMQILDKWYSQDFPAIAARLEELRDVDLAGLSDLELASHLQSSADFLRNGLQVHVMASMPHYFETTRLEMLCERLLGWDYAQVMELLAGTSEMSSRPSRELRRIAHGHLAGEEKEAAIREFQRFFGARSLSIELAEPTYAERPELFAAQLKAAQLDDTDRIGELREVRESAAAKARVLLTGSQLAEFNKALERALKGYPVREHNVFYTLDAPLAVVRYAALETGRRMVSAGSVRTVDDVFFCTIAEAAEWLVSGNQVSDTVRRRRGERAWALGHPGPVSYGTFPEMSSLRWLPEPVRDVMQVLLRSSQHNLALELSRQRQSGETGQLHGLPASPGTYEGTARVITAEGQFHRIRNGDVLVCPSTRPSWSIIFSAVGAIVTEAGGDLSHPAIIAREHRIPAVVATGTATQEIRDGEKIRVDGTNGVVFLDRPRPAH